MRFHDINEIARSAREQLVCPKCGRHFAEHALEVVEVQGGRGVFASQCTHCGTSSMMIMNIREFTQRINTREKQVRQVQTSSVCPGDVMEVKQFLDAFDGDFRAMLEPKKNQSTKKNMPLTSEQTPPPSPLAGL